MHGSNLASRRKAPLTQFSLQRSEGLSRPQRKLVGQRLFGVPASQDVKLSAMARRWQEGIELVKTEDRRSRNLANEELEIHLQQRLAQLGSRGVEKNPVLCLDRSDVRKEHAKKMEYLTEVYDGSTGEVHAGDGWCDVTAAERRSSEMVPL